MCACKMRLESKRLFQLEIRTPGKDTYNDYNARTVLISQYGFVILFFLASLDV